MTPGISADIVNHVIPVMLFPKRHPPTIHVFFRVPIHAIIIAFLAFLAVESRAEDDSGRFSLLARCGASVPLSDMNERTKVWLPYLSLAFRASAPPEWSRYLAFEVEAGFYGYRAREETAGKRPRLYAEPVMVSVMGVFPLLRGISILPSFGAGMTFTQVRNSSSSGSYNHVACAPGIELSYRFSGLVSAGIRVRAVFGFDRDRVFYHIVPDAGVAFHF
ncbi:MAG: hypothetical protein A2176_02180 [Spirochaetes bacterium RBG_13_51_14]|nr:MAG: hypothetical protein A2176_02180 [Spirochaetes bacterium RBG_13_51_14]